MSDFKVLMHSGTLVDVLEPDPESLLLEDIAYHLGNEPRFAGAIGNEYTVGHHSVLVALLCLDATRDWHEAERVQACRAGLFHDAPEAVFRDLPKDVKGALRFIHDAHGASSYDILEDRMMRAVSERFGIVWTAELKRIVKEADNAALAAEVHTLWPLKLRGHFNCGPPQPYALEALKSVHNRLQSFSESFSARRLFARAAAACAFGLSPALLPHPHIEEP